MSICFGAALLQLPQPRIHSCFLVIAQTTMLVRHPIILAETPERQVLKDGHDSRDDDDGDRITPVVGPRSVKDEHKSVERIAKEICSKSAGNFATSRVVDRGVGRVAGVQKTSQQNVADANHTGEHVC